MVRFRVRVRVGLTAHVVEYLSVHSHSTYELNNLEFSTYLLTDLLTCECR